jgi:hypothetical protein
MRLASLPSKHYAADWVTNELHSLDSISDLGCRYANMPAELPSLIHPGTTVTNPAKQALLLAGVYKIA